MRNTKQKNLIYSIINNNRCHLDAYHIYELCKKEIPNISLGTIYRNLSNLVDEGKVVKIRVGDFDRYDINIMHAHFICDKCGEIIDVFDNFLDDIDYIHGNMVVNYEIKFNGICKKCIGGNDN